MNLDLAKSVVVLNMSLDTQIGGIGNMFATLLRKDAFYDFPGILDHRWKLWESR